MACNAVAKMEGSLRNIAFKSLQYVNESSLLCTIYFRTEEVVSFFQFLEMSNTNGVVQWLVMRASWEAVHVIIVSNN